MQELLRTMRTLRGPNGCPWDKAQTHATLRPFLLEEAAEAVDAVGDDAALCGELGDVLLQVAFHAVIAEERGAFDYAGIERGIVEKLVRRHPHIFGTVQAKTPEDVYAVWNKVKAQERGGKAKPLASQIPNGLGALERERKAQKLLGAATSTPTPTPAQAKAEAQQALANAEANPEGVAAALQAAVAWARACGVNPELALREATNAALKEAEAQPTPNRQEANAQP